MRHRKAAKLGMKSQHRTATMANLVSSLIKHKRITTTVAKAKAARRLADQMVTLGKAGTVAARRLASARLQTRGPGAVADKEIRKRWSLRHDVIRMLFEDIAPSFKDRQGGYTRIIRVGQRPGDAAELAILEWTGTITTTAAATPETDKGKKAEKADEKKS